MTKTIEIEVPGTIPGDFDYINVEFTVETRIEDDSITVDGYSDDHKPYVAADGNPTWSRAKHTKWENDSINMYMSIKENMCKVIDELVELQTEEYACAEPDYD